MHIAVYCSSSNQIDAKYRRVAKTLGQQMAERGHTLVYGGGRVGLMGVIARAVHEGEGTVVGVIPERLKSKEGIAYGVADEMIVTKTMRERKRHMYERADAFIVLPGGLGTLEEFMEVLTLKQLAYHGRPITLINTDGFFDTLLDFFEELLDGHFARGPVEELVGIVTEPDQALAYIDTHAVAGADGREG
jgi:hypothetical protein